MFDVICFVIGLNIIFWLKNNYGCNIDMLIKWRFIKFVRNNIGKNEIFLYFDLESY